MQALVFTIDLPAIGGIIADLGVSIASYAGIAAILYAIGDILIRTVSWSLDTMLINLIAKFYEYYEKILNGTIFTEEIVNGMMNRVYLLIGVVIVFRLGMLLVQYIINPAEVIEEKGGVNALVKRAIIGLIIMIFIPTIFNLANDLQAAILKDQVIEKIIMDEEDLEDVKELSEEYGMGRVLGMTVFQGFWNVERGQVSPSVSKAYDSASEKFDPNIMEDAGYDILHKTGDDYTISYFPILSTVILGYVLYLIIKYCLDMVVRLFKLLILQVIAPVTIVEYIVNSDRNEVFKKWRTSVIANYAMLFIRVFTIWFVAWIAMLLKTGVDGESLINEQDYLLKAIIVLGLLAFMMDFPKMMSDIFGLDLEQDSAVKGVLGKAIGVGMAGLAIGGAVAGFGVKAAGGTSKALKGGLHNMQKGAGLKNNLSNFTKGFKSTAAANHLGSTLKGGLLGAGAAIMNSNSVTGSMYKGYSGATNSAKAAVEKSEANKQKSTDQLVDTVKSQAQNNPTATKQQIIDSVLNTQISAKLNGVDIGELTADISGRLVDITNSGGQIQPQNVVQHVQQVLSSKLGVSKSETTQVVNQVLGDSVTATPQQVDQIVNQVVEVAKSHDAPEVTQIVNQVMGTVADTTISDVTQKVNQESGHKIDAKVDDVTRTVKTQYEDEGTDSLFDELDGIATRTSSGEIETIFDTEHMDG